MVKMKTIKRNWMCKDDEIYYLYKQNLLKGMDEDNAYIEAQSEVFCRACNTNGMFEGGDRDYR